MSKLYNVGAYIRLSVEDTVYDSESVENQREMLSKFITMMPGWIEHRLYIDNGYSGATFQRPAFQEMMQDVRSGRVNLVLVKDLSRFGRNYLEAGRYLEEELPSLGCRFVALSDGIDTENGENDIMPFLNAMNDYYLKNLSDRIRSVLEAKARDGQKIAGNAPYGYLRDPDDHTRLIVDEYAAGVVRRIYEMRKQGTGFPTIVKALNTDGILPPMIYYLEKTGKDSSHVRTRHWIITTVSMLLKRETYIGTAEQLVKTVVSHRNKREVFRPKDERIRVENAFPAIIDKETWDAVQEVNRRATESVAHRSKPQRSLYSGLLVCADCGLTMSYWNPTKTYRNGKRIGYASFQCRTFQSTSGASCSRHTISEKTLGQIVLGHIREMAKRIALDETAMRESLTQRLTSGISVSKSTAKKERRKLELDLRKLEIAISKLYEDWVGGVFSEDTFSELMSKYETERNEKQQRLTLLEQSERDVSAKVADIERWMQIIKDHAAADTVDRELLESLIEKIVIGECTTAGELSRQDVQIYYRFVGLL